MMFKYEIVLRRSRDDGAFVAQVPQLPGCMAHGETREAALRNANQAIELWIETALEFGDPVPESRGARAKDVVDAAAPMFRG